MELNRWILPSGQAQYATINADRVFLENKDPYIVPARLTSETFQKDGETVTSSKCTNGYKYR